MLLVRIAFSLLLACTVTAQAEELLAMSTTLSDSVAPTSLTSARNITLELLPDTQTVADKSDLWARIRNGFAMRDLDSPLVAKHEQWYASRPDYMMRMTDRGRRYLHYITEEVERRGMPSEIALLPMIESAFNPGANSVARASGIWQFIPSTGKHFGMQQNWWYDGRRDVVGATNGALDYLQKLHTQFGDWELALAAYNCGEGAIARAQERNRRRGLPVNYASLQIPVETRNYVPKLLAIKNIVARPASYGLVLQPIENKPYFAAISTTKQMDVKKFAELADISMEEFTALNPAHNRPVILQDHNDLILLPVDHVETFLTNLEKNDKPLVSWQSYQPKKGERLDQLAPRFGLSVETLKSVNSLSARASESSGQTLLVPLNGESTNAELEEFNLHLLPEHESTVRELHHTVRKGESLRSIAQHYHVKPANLQAWNHHLKHIQVGQTLTIMQGGKGHGRHLAAGRHGKHFAQHGKARHYSQHHGRKLARG